MTEASPPRLHPAFASACSGRPRTRKARSPRISLRMTEDELARLKDLAGPTSVSAFVRERLFGESASHRPWFTLVPDNRPLRGIETGD